MTRQLFLSLVMFLFMAFPVTSWAQQKFDLTTIKFDPSRLFPILSETDILGTPDSSISNDAMKKIDDRCMSRVPDRFTPDAHRTYCACSSAATQGTVTVGELRELQKEKSRVLGNKTFEKYMTNVMKPCMTDAIEDVEYMFCIMSRDNDWRIRLPIPYCKCSSRAIKKDFETFGLEHMMISWGRSDIRPDESPVDTLWSNSQFLKTRELKKEECVGAYMHPDYFK